MKHLFTLLTILFVTTALFAQNNMPKGINDDSFFSKDFQKNEDINRFDKAENEFNHEFRK